MSHVETRFSLLFNSGDINDYYWDNGYVILSSLIEAGLIDRFLVEYEKIKHDDEFVFYSQSTHRVMRPTLSEHGYITESMENATNLGLYPEFSGAMKDCIHHGSVSEVLKLISGYEKHVMWENMFFDRSVGTIEHQDHWYLDTEPAGHLVGVWIALEDIHEDSGPFFIVPGSHKHELIGLQDAKTHEEFRLRSKEMIRARNYEFIPCLLKKGDVIFWHPSLVHGAFSNSDERFSRKSFTSHYYPYGMRTSRGDTMPPAVLTHNPELLRLDFGDEAEINKMLIQRYKQQGDDAPVVCDMRRESYD